MVYKKDMSLIFKQNGEIKQLPLSDNIDMRLKYETENDIQYLIADIYCAFDANSIIDKLIDIHSTVETLSIHNMAKGTNIRVMLINDTPNYSININDEGLLVEHLSFRVEQQ